MNAPEHEASRPDTLIPPAADLMDTSALRAAMVAELRGMGAIRTDEVAAAFRRVPRHVFAPHDPVRLAYAANTSVWGKRDERGVLVSTVSAAHIQAVQLEQAAVAPGMRVLEIGSGGYNAALLAELVGPTGEVTTVDIDPEIIDRARACLDTAGYPQVRTVVADADTGVAEFAPYDRIVVTVRSWDLPPAWTSQLAPCGRIVVPLRLRGLTRTVSLDHNSPTSREHGAAPVLSGGDMRLCSFVPMRGSGAYAEPGFTVDSGRIRIMVDDPDAPHGTLAGAELPTLAEMMSAAVRCPPVELWSGVEFDHVDQLDLWLGTFVPGFAVLAAEESVVAEGLLTPAVRRGAPTSITRGGFAYRTKRPIPDQPGRFETGVLAWGPDAHRVGADYLEVIRRWGRHRDRGGAGPRLAVHPAGAAVTTGPDQRVIDKTHIRIVVDWS